VGVEGVKEEGCEFVCLGEAVVQTEIVHSDSCYLSSWHGVRLQYAYKGRNIRWYSMHLA
jgi:hypothetical protein